MRCLSGTPVSSSGSDTLPGVVAVGMLDACIDPVLAARLLLLLLLLQSLSLLLKQRLLLQFLLWMGESSEMERRRALICSSSSNLQRRPSQSAAANSLLLIDAVRGVFCIRCLRMSCSKFTGPASILVSTVVCTLFKFSYIYILTVYLWARATAQSRIALP